MQIVALTLVLLVASETLRHAGKWVSWTLFLFLPLALTPYWFSVNDFDLFQWAKIYTVCFCAFWGAAMRFTPLGDRSWARATIHLLLAGNILEATALDLYKSGVAHKLNAIAGLLLIVVLPYGAATTQIDTGRRCRDLHSETSRGWIVGYTLWNWTFVYLNYPSLSGHHTAVLAAALIVGMIDARRWTQTRAYTLGLNLFVTSTWYPAVTSWLDTADWFDERTGLVAACAAFAFVVGIAIRRGAHFMRNASL